MTQQQAAEKATTSRRSRSRKQDQQEQPHPEAKAKDQQPEQQSEDPWKDLHKPNELQAGFLRYLMEHPEADPKDVLTANGQAITSAGFVGRLALTGYVRMEVDPRYREALGQQ